MKLTVKIILLILLVLLLICVLLLGTTAALFIGYPYVSMGKGVKESFEPYREELERWNEFFIPHYCGCEKATFCYDTSDGEPCFTKLCDGHPVEDIPITNEQRESWEKLGGLIGQTPAVVYVREDSITYLDDSAFELFVFVRGRHDGRVLRDLKSEPLYQDCFRYRLGDGWHQFRRNRW